MNTNRDQRQFIINCDVEELVALLQADYHMSVIEAFDKVYNSELHSKLIDIKTGLYIQSPLYQYEYLKAELGEPADTN